MCYSIHYHFSGMCHMLVLIFIKKYYPDAVENQKDYSYNSSNKLPPNYNPLMFPFETDFLYIYHWGLLTHFPYLVA